MRWRSVLSKLLKARSRVLLKSRLRKKAKDLATGVLVLGPEDVTLVTPQGKVKVKDKPS